MATNPFQLGDLTSGGPRAPSGPATDPMFGGTAALPPAVQTPAQPRTEAQLSLPGMDPLGMLQSMGAPTPRSEPRPIERLRPNSELHNSVRGKLDAMLKYSKGKMQSHYHRWNFNEQKIQAYAGVHDYERLMEPLRQKGAAIPEPIQVVVPYSYATIHAAATFVATILLGRKPIFPLLATRGTEVDKARAMEAALQSQLDASLAYETLWQGIWDSFVYSIGPKRITWEERFGAQLSYQGGQRILGEGLTYAGNVLSAIDPYSFFPDPRVPMHKCNVAGDFMFSEMPFSEMVLRDMEKAGSLKWVDAAIKGAKHGTTGQVLVSDSRRRLRLGSDTQYDRPAGVVGFQTPAEGTVRLVPKDWGLGSEETSQLWKFMWFERGQIMQAEPLNMVHNQHPYVVPEPTSFGHDFMSLSMADMIGNFQDILSWLVSSRIENVRAAVQNSFAVDPARIDVNDIRSSTIGRLIRLKQTAMGLPVKDAIMQILVQDVTQGHLADMQNMRILADTITGVNDNMRGIQNPGGRRSATEARIAMQNGGGRLSQHAIRISSQAYHPMVNQMIMNTQQFMPDEMWVEMAGKDGTLQSNLMTPDMIIGSFNHQISDGTLPFDKMALVEVWKEIMLGVAQDPELRQGWDLNKIFEHTAELGGAKNISSFRKQQQPIMAGAMADPAQDPSLLPLGPAMPQAPLMLGSSFQG